MLCPQSGVQTCLKQPSGLLVGIVSIVGIMFSKCCGRFDLCTGAGLRLQVSRPITFWGPRLACQSAPSVKAAEWQAVFKVAVFQSMKWLRGQQVSLFSKGKSRTSSYFCTVREAKCIFCKFLLSCRWKAGFPALLLHYWINGWKWKWLWPFYLTSDISIVHTKLLQVLHNSLYNITCLTQKLDHIDRNIL